MSTIYAIIHQWHTLKVSVQLASIFFFCGYICQDEKPEKNLNRFQCVSNWNCFFLNHTVSCDLKLLNILPGSCYSNSNSPFSFSIMIYKSLNIIKWGYTYAQSGFITKQVIMGSYTFPLSRFKSLVWNDFIIFFGVKKTLKTKKKSPSFQIYAGVAIASLTTVTHANSQGSFGFVIVGVFGLVLPPTPHPGSSVFWKSWWWNIEQALLTFTWSSIRA